MNGSTVVYLAVLVVTGLLIRMPLWLQRVARSAARPLLGLRAVPPMQPVGPPIERIAADLRRLLRQHRTVYATPELTFRASRLRAIEGALTDCALDAARSLDVPSPPRPTRSPLTPAQLRALLTDLSTFGVVLPDIDQFHG